MHDPAALESASDSQQHAGPSPSRHETLPVTIDEPNGFVTQTGVPQRIRYATINVL